jgi:hypothetical protein
MQMVIVAGTGGEKGRLKDKEGIQNVETLGQRMAWVLKKLNG